MKIKLAILDGNQNYLSKITAIFNTKYADKLELYGFTDMEGATAFLTSNKVDVFLIGEGYDVEQSSIPKNCGFAYLVETNDVNTLNGRAAICKFQKAENLYKQILNVFSETASNISFGRNAGTSGAIMAFASPCGGVGTSTLAAACAMHFAKQGKNTLYLNLEKYGSSEVFFRGEGQFTMSDVIFAVKCKNVNIAMKLESCVRTDKSGVHYYAPTKTALDTLELSEDEVKSLLEELQASGEYDYIILDMDFDTEERTLHIIDQAHCLVWACDGSELATAKVERAYEALRLLQGGMDLELTEKISLIYNKAGSKGSKNAKDMGIRTAGTIQFCERGDACEIAKQISEKDLFDKLV